MPIQKQKIEDAQRISKGTGRFMIAVAILFDFIPLIMIIAAIGVSAYFVGGFNTAEEVANSRAGDAAIQQGGFWNTVGGYAVKGVAGTIGTAKVTKAVVAGGVVGIFIGPIIYTVGSYLSIIFGYLIFTFWFLFKGVNMWSFNSMQKVLVNLSAFIVELVPGVNILPGISIMVWRHVKLSQLEDREKNRERAHSISKHFTRFAHAPAH
jgi:hypothetical protein